MHQAKAACEPHCLSLAANSSSLCLCADMTSSTKPEIHTPPEDPATAIGNIHKKIGEDQMCSSKHMIMDRHTHKQTDTLATKKET